MTARCTVESLRRGWSRAGMTVTMIIAVVLFPVFLVAFPDSAGAQERGRLRIDELQVPDGAAQLQTVSGVVTDTIALSLRLMGEYSVMAPGDDTAPDRVIGGRCLRDGAGSILFQLSVVRSGGGEPLFQTEHVAESLFDVFDVADEAVLALLEGLNQRVVRFGALQVRAKPGQTAYSVALNGEAIAEGLTGTYENRRIVEGTYHLAVNQTRLVGPMVILEQPVEIRADRAVEVIVEPPAVLPEEEVFLRDRGVGRWGRGGTPETATAAAPVPRDAVDTLRALAGEGVLPPTGPLRSFLDHAAAIEEGMADSFGIRGERETGRALDPAVYNLAATGRESSGTGFGAVFPGTVERFVRENITEVGRYWKPDLSVHVSSEGTFLAISVDGIVGADRVSVEGPPGSGISGHTLRDGGSISPYGNGVYDDFLVRPDRIQPGDDYRFTVERMGTEIVLESEVRPYATVLATDIDVSSTPDGYLVEWRDIQPDVRHTIVISAPEHTMPPPGAWQWSAQVPSGEESFTVPRTPLGPQGERRIHLFSSDGSGNIVWSNIRFYHVPYRFAIRDVQERAIAIDGNDSDWRGIDGIDTGASTTRSRQAPGPEVESLYLAADDEYFYWAIRSVTTPRSFLPQLQIYNSFDENGKHNAALLVITRRGNTGEVIFDHWSDSSKRRQYYEGIEVASSDSFLEMRFPREYIDLEEFQLNLVAREREDGDFVRLVDNFFIRLP